MHNSQIEIKKYNEKLYVLKVSDCYFPDKFINVFLKKEEYEELIEKMKENL